MANMANIVRRANNANLVKGNCYQKPNNGMYLGAYYGKANGQHLFTYDTIYNNHQNVVNNLVKVNCRNNHAQVPMNGHVGGRTRRGRKSVRKTRRGRRN